MFPTLTMQTNTKMVFATDVPALTIKYRQQFAVDPTTLIDLTRITNEVKFESVTNDTSYKYVSLGTVLFSKSLQIDQVEAITLNSKMYAPVTANQTSINLFANNITVSEGADISADRILMFASSNLTVEQRATIKSTILNECSTDAESNQELYECMDLEFDSHRQVLNETYILKQYNE